MFSTKSFIDITEIYSLIQDLPFSEIQKIKFEDYGLTLRDHRNLFLIVANRSAGDSPFYETLTTLQQQCNGLIFEKDTNRLISGAPKICTPISVENLKNYFFSTGYQNEYVISMKPGQLRLEYAEDGTMIRLYNYKDTWYTSTTKCIDAQTSYWSNSKTFDDMFWDIFDKSQLEKLDKNFTYIFILLHTDNRIVVRHKFNRLVFISKIFNHVYSNQLYSNKKMCIYEDFSNIFYGSEFIKRPKLLTSLNLDNLNEVSVYTKRGIIVKIFDNTTATWNSFILDFEKYTLCKSIRGNVPNIQSRYLDLLKNKQELYLLQKFYPEFRQLFTDTNKRFAELCQHIYELYIYSHIKHEQKVDEDNPFYKTLKALHAQYKTSNEPVKYNTVRTQMLTHFNGKSLLKFIELFDELKKNSESIPMQVTPPISN